MEFQIVPNEIIYVEEFSLFLETLDKIGNQEISKIVKDVKTIETQVYRNQVNFLNEKIVPYVSIVREKTSYKHFTKYYDGINNTRINNVFFMREGIVNVPMIRDMITNDNVLKNLPNNPKDFDKTFFEIPSMIGGNSVEDSLKEGGKLALKLQEHNQNVIKYN